jgi:hypothetical protein
MMTSSSSSSVMMMAPMAGRGRRTTTTKTTSRPSSSSSSSRDHDHDDIDHDDGVDPHEVDVGGIVPSTSSIPTAPRAAVVVPHSHPRRPSPSARAAGAMFANILALAISSAVGDVGMGMGGGGGYAHAAVAVDGTAAVQASSTSSSSSGDAASGAVLPSPPSSLTYPSSTTVDPPTGAVSNTFGDGYVASADDDAAVMAGVASSDGTMEASGEVETTMDDAMVATSEGGVDVHVDDDAGAVEGEEEGGVGGDDTTMSIIDDDVVSSVGGEDGTEIGIGMAMDYRSLASSAAVPIAIVTIGAFVANYASGEEGDDGDVVVSDERPREGKAVEGKGREEEERDVVVLPVRGWRMDTPIPYGLKEDTPRWNNGDDFVAPSSTDEGTTRDAMDAMEVVGEEAKEAKETEKEAVIVPVASTSFGKGGNDGGGGWKMDVPTPYGLQENVPKWSSLPKSSFGSAATKTSMGAAAAAASSDTDTTTTTTTMTTRGKAGGTIVPTTAPIVLRGTTIGAVGPTKTATSSSKDGGIGGVGATVASTGGSYAKSSYKSRYFDNGGNAPASGISTKTTRTAPAASIPSSYPKSMTAAQALAAAAASVPVTTSDSITGDRDRETTNPTVSATATSSSGGSPAAVDAVAATRILPSGPAAGGVNVMKGGDAPTVEAAATTTAPKSTSATEISSDVPMTRSSGGTIAKSYAKSSYKTRSTGGLDAGKIPSLTSSSSPPLTIASSSAGSGTVAKGISYPPSAVVGDRGTTGSGVGVGGSIGISASKGQGTVSDNSGSGVPYGTSGGMMKGANVDDGSRNMKAYSKSSLRGNAIATANAGFGGGGYLTGLAGNEGGGVSGGMEMNRSDDSDAVVGGGGAKSITVPPGAGRGAEARGGGVLKGTTAVSLSASPKGKGYSNASPSVLDGGVGGREMFKMSAEKIAGVEKSSTISMANIMKGWTREGGSSSSRPSGGGEGYLPGLVQSREVVSNPAIPPSSTTPLSVPRDVPSLPVRATEEIDGTSKEEQLSRKLAWLQSPKQQQKQQQQLTPLQRQQQQTIDQFGSSTRNVGRIGSATRLGSVVSFGNVVRGMGIQEGGGGPAEVAALFREQRNDKVIGEPSNGIVNSVRVETSTVRGGELVGGDAGARRPMSVTITDPRTGKKRIITVSKNLSP